MSLLVTARRIYGWSSFFNHITDPNLHAATDNKIADTK